MNIFGLSLSVKKQPGPSSRLAVIEVSLTGHEQILHTMLDRLGVVEKKAEATRRKVYRDEEGPAPTNLEEAAPVVKAEELQAGDIIPPGLNF